MIVGRLQISIIVDWASRQNGKVRGNRDGTRRKEKRLLGIVPTLPLAVLQLVSNHRDLAPRLGSRLSDLHDRWAGCVKVRVVVGSLLPCAQKWRLAI